MWGRSENFHFQGVVALSRVGGGEGLIFLREVHTPMHTMECILKAHNNAKVWALLLRFSRNFPKIFRTLILKESLSMGVPYFIKENLWKSASDEATLTNFFGGCKPSSKLNLKTKWCNRCGYCDNFWSCERLKKPVVNILEKKELDLES